MAPGERISRYFEAIVVGALQILLMIVTANAVIADDASASTNTASDNR